jgi:excisionase family DNA binding protein
VPDARHGDEAAEPLLDVPAVATWLSVAPSWVYARAEDGSLPSFKVGRYRRFKRREIEEWLEKARLRP